MNMTRARRMRPQAQANHRKHDLKRPITPHTLSPLPVVNNIQRSIHVQGAFLADGDMTSIVRLQALFLSLRHAGLNKFTNCIDSGLPRG